MDFYSDLKEILYSTEINVDTVLIRMAISFALGAIIGVERQARRREAGIRTFTLICLGSTLAMLLSIWVPQSYPDFLNGDPGRIAAQVLTGIGFLGAGAIIQSRGSVSGLTTAACIWVVAVIGLAVGAGMFVAASIVTLLAVFILVLFEQLEKKMAISGINKILTVDCSTSEPNLEEMRKKIRSFKLYIVSSSYEYDYENNSSVLTYKVSINTKTSYSNLFAGIKSLGNVSRIKVLS